ncbi:methyltransferase domain-containing protein [Ditylenchus destructor]|uniref:Methyltransferase domain-containing protein n=1 Tax=Ditylenchus destructor TaxID=166010 RepID=A0AAD4MTA5_9BILA|nr:methyltransferase domain-containing protein [Ditylenchus destructor]
MSDANDTTPKVELPKSPDDAFAMKMMNIACNALLSGAINLGIDLGLFEALAKAGTKAQPATATDVAKMSGTKERYCQEWLCSMACGDVIEMDETGKHFWIPEESVSMMTGTHPHIGFMMNMALSAYGASYKQLCNVIKQDGPLGMEYSAYGEMYKKINFMSRAMHQKHLVKDLVPKLSMKEALSNGIKVLDVGCGCGFHAMELASHFPNSHFTGVDLGEEGIKDAQKEAAEKQLKNTSFMCANANKLDTSWTDKFDLVLIFDACHDQTRPDLMTHMNGPLPEFGKPLQECTDYFTSFAIDRGYLFFLLLEYAFVVVAGCYVALRAILKYRCNTTERVNEIPTVVVHKIQVGCQTEQFCSQIQGKEAEFVNTVLDLKKNGTEKEVCARSNFSVCDLSQTGKNGLVKPEELSTCEQCQSTTSEMTNASPDSLPRLNYYTISADLLKENCRNDDFGQFFSGLCTLIDGKEFEFVKSVMDCSGVKFKDDKVQPNCTVSGSNDESGRMPKVCESYVDSCKVDQSTVDLLMEWANYHHTNQLPDELPNEKLEYYTMATNSLKVRKVY